MKIRILLAFALMLVMSNVSSQTFPYAVYNSAAGNQNIRDGACVSGTNIITSLAPNMKLVASTSQNSCSYLWYRVDLPSALQSGNLFGWSCGGSPGGCDMMPASNTGYVEVFGTGSSGLYVRDNPGGNNITIGASNAKIWDTQCFATTGNTQFYQSYTWYEIYLPNNCSQTTGWSSGEYLNFYGPSPCTFSISPTSNSVTSSSNTGSVSVTTQVGCAWTASSNNSWINITSGSSGTGNGTVNYSVNSNSSSSPRTGTLTIAGQTFTINQAGLNCSYTISPTSNSVNSNAATSSVSVTTQTGCSWTASSNDSWITITSGSSGTGNGTVNYSVLANTNINSRVGTLTIQGNTFTINQAGVNCTYSISPTSNSINSSSATGIVSMNTQSGCSWIATSNDSWITITSGSSGSGNGTINYTASANGGTNPRTGTLTIQGNTFIVNQAGSNCTYSISPNNISANGSNNIGSVSVTTQTGCQWTATSNDSWVTITSGSSGTGNGTVGYNIGSNPNTNPRTGTITIAGLTFTIYQWGSSIPTVDDYPFRLSLGYNNNSCMSNGCQSDPWGFCRHYCTSYVAWKVNQFHGDTSITQTPTSYLFNNFLLGYGDPQVNCNAPGPGYKLSHACHWDSCLKYFYTIDNIPAVGAIAHWNENEGYGSLGHVAFVNGVNSNGTMVTITEYNYPSTSQCDFNPNIRTIPANQVGRFIHTEASGQGGVGVSVIPESQNTLNVFPNPNKGIFSCEYYSAGNQNTIITMFNVLGEIVYQVNTECKSGMNIHTISVADLVPGIYILQIMVDNQVHNERVIID